jgi:uncharacterized protein
VALYTIVLALALLGQPNIQHNVQIVAIEGDSMKSPFSLPDTNKVPPNENISFIAISFKWSIYIYQNYISPVNGRYCKMQPSCSRYCNDAVEKCGLLKGSVMAADRIHRCGHDLFQYKETFINGKILYIDSVKTK